MTQSSAPIRNDYEGYRQFWVAVLVSAVKDMDSYSESERREAKKYVFSTSTAPTSFCWICTILGVDANAFATACMSKNFRKEFCKHKFNRGD